MLLASNIPTATSYHNGATCYSSMLHSATIILLILLLIIIMTINNTVVILPSIILTTSKVTDRDSNIHTIMYICDTLNSWISWLLSYI